jgi:PAS domain S-box-containing protein
MGKDDSILKGDRLGALAAAVAEAAESGGIGIIVTLVGDGSPRNVYVSKAAARVMGWPREVLMARSALSFVAPEDLPRLEERYRRRAGGEQGPITYELEVVRMDGQRTPIEASVAPVVFEGRPGTVAFIVDLTARREAERAHAQSEQRFRELIEAAPEPIGIIRDGHFLYVNRAYVETLGYAAADELLKRPISSFLHPDDVALREEGERTLMRTGERLPVHVFRALHKNGSIVLLEVSTVPFEYEGRAAMLSMARDVTERKRMEAQLVQADRLAGLGTLAAGVAHEVNNPLAYVMLNLEWLARKVPELASDKASLPELVAMLEEARHGAERVAAIVQELRAFSRADGETRRRVDLRAAVEGAIKIAGYEIRYRARILTEFEDAPPIWANEARIEQVILNLLLNAAQAMPEGASAERNEIRVRVAVDGAGHVVLEVTDNGEGIPQATLSHIFDPFFTTKPVGVGTGLGLSICHSIVTALGGTIAVESQPGHGSTFRLAFPAATGNADPLPTREATSGGSPPGPRARVIVVDDELPIALTLRDLLGLDHDVTALTSAREALDVIGAGADVDVILCDLMMPGMSGIDLYERLRQERPGVERKIVFMTGGAFTARAVQFLANVANRRVEKPFDMTLVERIVREMVRGA